MSSINLQSKTYFDEIREELIKEMKGQNVFSIPSVASVSINVGVGKYEGKQRTEIAKLLEKLTGQKPKEVLSRLSIAGFNLRKGAPVGFVVTLRGDKMRDFLTQLIYLALPRTRDFKGVKSTAFDRNFSTYSLGIETASIFPVIGFDNGVDFGMQVNIVFKNSGEQNKELLTKLKIPFTK